MSKKILITGASTGMGYAKAIYCHQKGHHVYAAVRKQADADRLREEGIDAVFMDVNDLESIYKVHDKIEQEGGLDILVNNAGIAYSGPLEAMDDLDIVSIIKTNTSGAILVTKIFLPMIRKSQGRILNIGSISGRLAPPGLSVYAASKFALEGLSDALRVELAAFKVKVSIIEPGKIVTPIWEKGLKRSEEMNRHFHIKSYEKLERFIRHHAEHSPGIPMATYLAVVDHALFSDTPRARYLLNTSARLRVLINLLPAAWRDALLRKAIGL